MSSNSEIETSNAETQQESNAEEAALVAEEQDPESITVPCCSEDVHIAFRSKADDRLYMTYNRKWQEVRYFRQEGLRVFCASCRHRVY